MLRATKHVSQSTSVVGKLNVSETTKHVSESTSVVSELDVSETTR